MIHKINIFVHVLTGTVALIIGLMAIFSFKRSVRHKKFGRYFLYLISIVVTTGFFGWLFFRSNSFLLMLTILSGYVSFAGYRNIMLREKRSKLLDVLVAIVTLTTGLLYLFWLRQGDGNWSHPVIYSTVTALGLVTTYDLTKHFIFYEQLKTWWLYEHIYKMISAFSALLSAFAGTVLPESFKPYSQIGPSIMCIWLIIFFICQQGRRRSLRMKGEAYSIKY